MICSVNLIDVKLMYVVNVCHQGKIDTNDLHFTKGRAYRDWGAYGQSKLGDLLLAKSVADKTKDTNTTGGAKIYFDVIYRLKTLVSLILLPSYPLI